MKNDNIEKEVEEFIRKHKKAFIALYPTRKHYNAHLGLQKLIGFVSGFLFGVAVSFFIAAARAEGSSYVFL